MPYGMCYVHIFSVGVHLYVNGLIDTFISGVGFRVARSTVPGNARASMRGTSDGENSHAFLYMYVSINIIFLSLGVYRIATNNGKYGNFTESYV